MKVTLLCNAGLALEIENAMLLVDVPNQEFPPFYCLPEETWQQILNRQPPYNKVCGFWFTHDHPDHCHIEKIREYQRFWPEIPVFVPGNIHVRGKGTMGPFVIEYQRMDHAPIPDAPPHVVTWIEAGGRTLYLAADAMLDPEAHRAFLRDRRADAAVWNSMYLSRPDTRLLMQETAWRNLIYHMPAQRPDESGLWRKLEKNLERFGSELQTVTILDRYPTELEL